MFKENNIFFSRDDKFTSLKKRENDLFIRRSRKRKRPRCQKLIRKRMALFCFKPTRHRLVFINNNFLLISSKNTYITGACVSQLPALEVFTIYFRIRHGTYQQLEKTKGRLKDEKINESNYRQHQKTWNKNINRQICS